MNQPTHQPTRQPGFVLLYVNNMAVSLAFYRDLFGLEAVQQSPAFALFVLESGLEFGLWLTATVEPPVAVAAGGMELAVVVANRSELQEVFEQLRSRHIAIAQTPVDMDFGYTFVVLDPDGHRLRFFVPGPQ
jgi:catechol 2,3-dioxygenase-like lactoylglutathione lyase family enzyme